MRNVIVFEVEHGRFAVELRWVREVITLGHVTPVPGAPIHVGGAVNVRGTITPVLDVGIMRGRTSLIPPPGHSSASAQRPDHGRRDPRGDGAVLLDVDGVALALRVVKVDEVATASEHDGAPADDCAGAVSHLVLDSKGQPVPLIDPPELMSVSLAAAHALAAGASALSGGRTALMEDGDDFF